MEASEYFATYDRLAENLGRLELDGRRWKCVVRKVVWSSFDFTTGPELRFVWDTENSFDESGSSPSSANDEQRSLDSSFLSTSNNYEQIDDPLQEPLVSLNVAIDDSYSDEWISTSASATSPNTTMASSTRQMEESQGFLSASALESSGTSSASTARRTPYGEHPHPHTSTPLMSPGAKVLPPSFSTPTCSSSAQTTPEKEKRASAFGMADSGVAPTISAHSELSALVDNPDLQLKREVWLEEEEEIDRQSASSSSHQPPAADFSDWQLPVASSRHSGSGGGDASSGFQEDELSDEQLVARFALAEQICAPELPSEPLLHKITRLAGRSRRSGRPPLLVASFLWAGRGKERQPTLSDENFGPDSNHQPRTLHALSFLLPADRTDWYTRRIPVFRAFCSELVPRLRAHLLVDDWADTAIAVTRDVRRFLLTLDATERLAPPKHIPIALTYFGDVASGEILDDAFLSRVFSAFFQTGRRAVIVLPKDDVAMLEATKKLFLTLALLLPPDERRLAISTVPSSIGYSPLLPLQTIERQASLQMLRDATLAERAPCVLDVQKKLALVSALRPSKHRELRERSETARVEAVLTEQHVAGGAMLARNAATKLPTIELRPAHSWQMAADFWRRHRQLPPEPAIRSGHVGQFLLEIGLRARTLLHFTKRMSAPSHTLPADRKSAVVAADFRARHVRRAIPILRCEVDWWTAVMEAERRLSGVLDLLYANGD